MRRHELGLTQQDVAVRAGCSVSYVRLLESGYLPEASEVLDRIGSVLGPAHDDAPADNGRVGKERDAGAHPGG